MIPYFLMLALWTACERQAAPLPPAQNLGAQADLAAPRLVKTWKDSLASIFQMPHKIIEEGPIVTIELEGIEAQLESKLIQIAKTVYQKDFPFQILLVRAVGPEDTLLHATLRTSDVQAYLKSEISEPEMVRRFEVEIIETLRGIQKRAINLRKEGKNSQAIPLLKKWLEKEESALALALLGNSLRDEKNYGEAIGVYKKLLGLDPASIFAWYNLGFIYDILGDYKEAITAYQKALGEDPQILQQLAEVYRKNGDGVNALLWLNKLKLDPKNSDAWLIEGNLYRDQKAYDQAQEAYAKGQAVAPEDHRFLFNQILVDMDLKQMEVARSKYSQLKEKAPDLAKELSGYLE